MLSSIVRIIQSDPLSDPFAARTYRPLSVLLISILFALPLSSAAQTTQTLALESGWNTVSLYVQPSDSSFATLFDETPVSMVKNEDGEVYLPGEGIEEIASWRSDEGYQIYTETTTKLDVTGLEASPGATAIELKEGWNLVPYLSAQAQAVEAALVSIDESLVVVEDEDGVQYDPSASSSPLDSLRPGQGYKVYVDRVDTLRYPEFAQTLDEALALTGMAEGTYVQVRGYDKPGDGGGGLFRVTSSGAATDGGTCFMFDEDLSAEVTEQKLTTGMGSQSIDLQETDISWRTLEVRYGNDDNDVITPLYLSGFNQNTGGQADLFYDLAAGTVEVEGISFVFRFEENVGWDRGSEYDATYKHTSSDRRLERVRTFETVEGVPGSPSVPKVSPKWWGAPVADPNTPKPADAHIRHAMVAAANIVKNSNYDWSVVAFDTTFYYQHKLELLTGNYYKGTGSLNSDGYTRGGIKGLPGELLDYRLDGFDMFTDANNREDAYLMGNDMQHPQPTLDKGTERFGFDKFKVDGNVRNNMQVFNNLGDYNDLERHMQNSGSWSGFADKFFKKPDGLKAVYKDVNYVDLGGSGLQQGPDADIQDVLTAENINVRDTRRNHLLYGLVGDGWNNITIEGQFWGGVPILDPRGKDVSTTVTNLTIKNLEEGQFAAGNALAQRKATGPDGGLTVDDFTYDARGLVTSKQTWAFFRVNDRGFTAKNGTMYGQFEGDNNTGIVDPVIFNRATFPGNVRRKNHLKNIDFFDAGEGYHIYNEAQSSITDLLIEDFTYEAESGTSLSGNRPIPFRSGVEELGTVDYQERQHRVVHRNVQLKEAHEVPFEIKGSASTPYHPHDWYTINGSLQNQGRLFSQDSYDDSFLYQTRVFLSGTTINSFSGSSFHKQMRPERNECVRLRNVDDRSGRTSDQVNQSYTATSEDESNGYALIPTSLLSRAWETSVTANASYNVTAVEIANSDGTLRTDDNTGQRDPYLKVSVDGSITQGDTFEWTARVTPTEYYQTAGTFIARRIDNKSFASGNGSFTVDLMGVASAQDMDMLAKPTYTASSGDTSIVTASVQGNGHTLELTEQGTGTATITATGDIPNVGTVTTTFEVTVE